MEREPEKAVAVHRQPNAFAQALHRLFAVLSVISPVLLIVMLGIGLSQFARFLFLPHDVPNHIVLESEVSVDSGAISSTTKLTTNLDDQVHSFMIPPSPKTTADAVARLTKSVKLLEDDLQGIEPRLLKAMEKRLMERDTELHSWILASFKMDLKEKKPNYALILAGALIIPHLTSPTYQPYPNFLRRKLYEWLFSSTAPITSQPPSTALKPDNTLGNCWPFPGHNGTLAIVLTRRIIVQELVIEHTPPELAYDVWSAPREFRLLGSDKEPDQYYQLREGVFDIFKKGHIQSFPIEHPLPIRRVFLHILSNHGDTDFTCLYQVRIHGMQV